MAKRTPKQEHELLLSYGCSPSQLDDLELPAYLCNELDDPTNRAVIVIRTKFGWRIHLNLRNTSHALTRHSKATQKNGTNIDRLAELANHIIQTGYPPAIVAQAMTLIQADKRFGAHTLRSKKAEELLAEILPLAASTQIPAQLKLKLLPHLAELDLATLEEEIAAGAPASYAVSLYAPENILLTP
jgi:hypothetical protein